MNNGWHTSSGTCISLRNHAVYNILSDKNWIWLLNILSAVVCTHVYKITILLSEKFKSASTTVSSNWKWLRSWCLATIWFCMTRPKFEKAKVFNEHANGVCYSAIWVNLTYMGAESDSLTSNNKNHTSKMLWTKRICIFRTHALYFLSNTCQIVQYHI